MSTAKDTVRLLAVPETAEAVPSDALWPVLAQVFNMTFTRRRDGVEACGEIVFRDPGSTTDVATGISKLSLPLPMDSPPKAANVNVDVRFADTLDVPRPFRGRVVSTVIPDGTETLQVDDRHVVLATTARGPIWTSLRASGPKVFRSSLVLPTFSEAGFSERCSTATSSWQCYRCFISFEELGASASIQLSSLRASFIIDDPNLHWPRYGYIDYRQVAEQAAREGYHVSFATIPLDMWLTHEGTAEIFAAIPGGCRFLSTATITQSGN